MAAVNSHPPCCFFHFHCSPPNHTKHFSKFDINWNFSRSKSNSHIHSLQASQDSFLLDDINTLITGCNSFVIAGDLYAKHPLWNSCSVNPASQTLCHIVQRENYSVIALTTYTHFPDHPGHKPDVLDIALTKLPKPKRTLVIMTSYS